MEDESFWAPRPSLRTPIPELSAAADILALATDSLLAGDERTARSYLDQANMPALRTYTRSIQSQTTREIHRLREVPGLAARVPKLARGPRNPSPTMALAIYRRDGFRCRYCGCRIIAPHAQRVISALLPGAVQWGTKDAELNAAFYTLKGVLDHVDPHTHGGSSGPENLVVSCQPCNYGKGDWFIQQLGLADPRLRPPEASDWDGLLRVLSLQRAKARDATEDARLSDAVQQPVAPERHVSIDDNPSAFGAATRQRLEVLLQVIRRHMR